jgi:hypothetical protein
VVDTGTGPTAPDDDLQAKRECLWHRLLNGELTEVFEISGLDFVGWLMGLEPISAAAYEYNADGEPTTAAERAEIAQQLSQQRFWTVSNEYADRNGRIGSVTAWDRHFIDRAQIALIVPRTRRSELLLQRIHVLLRRRRADDPVFAADAEPDRALMRFHKSLRRHSGLYGPPPYSYVVVRYLLANYPEKTLVVSNPYDVNQLARLRIRRR